jgi:hypothetical protein
MEDAMAKALEVNDNPVPPVAAQLVSAVIDSE